MFEILGIIAGVIVLALTLYALIKRIETRIVLIAAGLLMCILTLKPLTAFDAFADRMVTASLIQAISSVMGFAYVMKYTKCDQHLIGLFAGFLGKLGIFMIPAATLITFVINIPLTSAAGCAAAVGAIFVPLLMSKGVHPATAAAAVALGTYGSAMSPGNSHNPFVANLAGMDLIKTISIHAPYTAIMGIIGAIVITMVAYLTKTASGYEDLIEHKDADSSTTKVEKINFFMAFAPILPIVVLLVSSFELIDGFKTGVAQAMLIGALYGIVITKTNPVECVKRFFDGAGNAYGNIIGIIIAAAVFVQGLKQLGLIQAFIDLLINTPGIARVGGTLGPMLLGIITGSGDAAAYAFNEGVTPFAASFGMNIAKLGSAVQISGALGRTMSPLAGALIVVAGLANIDTLEVAKKTAPAMILNVLIVMFIFL